MFLFGTALLTTHTPVAVANSPMVAIAARFYYPPGGKRTSYHQIYLCDMHGRNRRQVTFGASERFGLRWLGRNKLAWIETIGVTKTEVDYGFHTDFEARSKLVEYDLKTNERRTVAEGYVRPDGNYRETVLYPRGQAVYKVWKKNPYANQMNPDDSDGDALYTVKNGQLQKVRIRPKTVGSTVDSIGLSTEGWRAAGFDVTDMDMSKEMVGYGAGGGTGEGAAYTITYRGKKVTVMVPEPDFVWKSKMSNHCWLKTSSIAGSGGSDMCVYWVDLLTGKAKLVINEVLDLDFQGDDGLWASSSNNKGIAPLGKLSVWARDLWAGDVRTGKQWRLFGGAVHGVDARIRPS